MITNEFIRGMLAMGFLIAAGFFLRFWRESRDRLFGLFSLAFLLLAINRMVLSFLHEDVETSLSPYVIRLLAFVIILVAIIDKNIAGSDSP